MGQSVAIIPRRVAMLGWIMPAPLVIPAILYSTFGAEGSVNVRDISFGKVSVVQIAWAAASQCSCESPNASYAAGTFLRIFAIGNLCPITPVLMTIDLPPNPSSSCASSKQASAAFPMLCASSSPPLPVTAFAHPEFTIMERIPTFLRVCSTFRLTVTGAAWKMFLVKVAAALHGDEEARRARSGRDLLVAFTPTWVEEMRKPLG